MPSLLNKLKSLGFQVSVADGKLRYKYVGEGDPPAAAADLIRVLRAKKEKIISFLRTRCADCGGIVFWEGWDGSRHCLACEPLDPDAVDRLPDRTRVRPPAPAANGSGKT
jgi:hypothetical protein